MPATRRESSYVIVMAGETANQLESTRIMRPFCEAEEGRTEVQLEREQKQYD